ncbi:MAG: porin family protein [Bacteroidota bacterium]
MKKYIITGILALSIVAVNAQAKFELGLKGGLNLANLSTDAQGSYDSRTGYHVGAYSLIKIASIGIQPELLFSAQGTEISDVSTQWSQDMKYFLIPVMVKFYLPLGLNLQAGPQFGILTDAKLDDGTTTEDIKSEFKDSDVSLALGAGWDLPFGVNIAARYVLGVNDIANDPSIDTKNRVFQVSAGFRLFKVGK